MERKLTLTRTFIITADSELALDEVQDFIRQGIDYIPEQVVNDLMDNNETLRDLGIEDDPRCWVDARGDVKIEIVDADEDAQ